MTANPSPGEAELEPADDALSIAVPSPEPMAAAAAGLDHAVRFRVSDLFFCAEERYLTVAARHLGMLRRISQVPPEIGKRCIAHIKSQAGMDITEKRRPQDGRWKYQRNDE